MNLPPILGVNDVMTRYGFRDERTARRLMNDAGAFKAGGRLVIRQDDLDGHERRLRQQQQPLRAPIPRYSAPTRDGKVARISRSPAQGPDWWRTDLPATDTPA